MNHTHPLTHYFHSHTDTQTTPILTQTYRLLQFSLRTHSLLPLPFSHRLLPFLQRLLPFLHRLLPCSHRHFQFSLKTFIQDHSDTHTTTIFTWTYRQHLYSLRHTDYTYCLCLLKTYRLLPLSHRQTNHSHSHTDKQTTPILTHHTDTKTTPILTQTQRLLLFSGYFQTPSFSID